MKAIITAGGRGTRMRPLTFSSNKHFIPLANKPLLFYAIEEVVEAGIKEIGINYNPGQLEEIKSYLGDGKKWGIRFSFILQEAPLGLAHIVKSSQSFVGKEKFLMHLGDNIFFGGIKSQVQSFEKGSFNGLVTVVHHQENWRLGVPYFDRQGKMVKYVEKPKKPPHDWAIPGLYFFDRRVFECFEGKEAIKPSLRGELEISSPYQWLIDHQYRVGTVEFKGVWKDPGKFDDWLDTNQFLLDQLPENGNQDHLGQEVKVEGRVKIGPKCRLKNSIIRGPVVIGEKVIIENSFIGPYSSIGDGCQILDAKIENSILVKNVIIKKPAKAMDSSLIGEESIIEGNSKIMDSMELFIGNQCIVKL